MKGQPSGSMRRHQDLVLLTSAEVREHQGLDTSTESAEIVVDLKEFGDIEQCIYVVPTEIRKVNPEAYTPQVVSIGPFHNPHRSGGGDNFLEPMEELKQKYLEEFLNRTGQCAEDFGLKIKEWENRIRSCYAGPVNNNDFLNMILIDACFIIEHFLRCYKQKVWKENDPLLLKSGRAIEIKRDLILLENQLPFFVLEGIYNLAGMNIEFPSFLEITFDYFRQYKQQNMNPEGVCPKHFTDLLRTFMLPPSFDHETTVERGIIEHLYSATQLSEAGLVFKAIRKGKSLLDLEFHKGVLTMPSFRVHDSTEIYIRNILAFEWLQW